MPFVLTIIDTPGFGDTHGIKRDKEIKEQIHQLFSRGNRGGIDQLHGIGFVVQASLPRLTPAQEYIFNAALSIFGKNIVATFADGSEPAVLEAVRKANIPYKESFRFNNVAIYAPNRPRRFDFNPIFWQMSSSGYDNFFSHFTRAKPKSLALTREVLKERRQLERLLSAIQHGVRIALSTLSDIEKEKELLKKHEADIKAYQNFTYTVTRENVRKVALYGVHTATCLRCSYTCHGNCKITSDGDKSRCSAMHNGYCTICPGRCHWTNHSNIPYRFEYYTVNETQTSYDLKRKHELAESGKKNVEGVVRRYKSRLQELQVEVFSLIEKARVSIKRLEEIALRPHPLDELKYLDLLIRSEEDQQKPGWKTRVTQYRKVRKNAEILEKLPTLTENSVADERWWAKFLW